MVKGLEHFPFCAIDVPIIETEEHLMTEWPLYHAARSGLSDKLKSLLTYVQEYVLIMSFSHILEFGNFLKHCQPIRIPKRTFALQNNHIATASISQKAH